MNGGPQRRPPGRGGDLRLEGLVVKKSLTRVETPRYLVLDFRAGSISLYKKPPPKDEFAAMQKRSKSVPSKFMASVGLKRSMSDEGGGGKGPVTCENLAHISRQPRHFAGGAWDPKFTVPANVGWKIRDVENDETTFHLILPPDFKSKDSEVEVFATAHMGRGVSYRALGPSLVSIKEGEEASVGASKKDPFGSGRKYAKDNDDSSVSSTASTKSSIFKKTFKRAPAEEQEIVYQFRVLLDGNEKFIWLQAAAELGRLCDKSAVNFVSSSTAKLFVLPTMGTGSRSNLTALRYAEWARLIDQNKNVSKFHYDPHDIDHHFTEPQAGAPQDQALDDSNKYNATRLVKVVPTYAYRNRRMTEKDLYYEMTTASEKWEDFRGQRTGDRDEAPIGSLHAEVLACHGLPKLDKLSSTDAVCYFVCGPYAFATDVIDGFLSPVWPSKSRRACIFPLFHAYQKMYVGVFDDDGPGANDDFAGRVVIDMARLRPNSVYDIFLPLRLYQNTYVRKSRGVIHLRLRVEWTNEKKALLTYFKRPKKTKQLGNAVTVNCADLKAFRNVVLTVQGKDVPGRYKQLVQKGLQREMKLYKLIMKTTMKEQMMDIVLYANPSLSLCVFFAWMHSVYSNSPAWLPVYFMAAIIALLVRNYFEYGPRNIEFNFGFAPITIPEMFKVLLWGGPGTKYIKAIKVERQSDLARTARSAGSRDEIDGDDDNLMLNEAVFQGGGFRMDGDHMEFPFSEAGRYAKKTLSEACVDANALFAEDEEEDAKSSGKLSSFSRKAKKGSIPLLPKAREEDDADEEDEFGLMVKSSVPEGSESISRGQSLMPQDRDGESDEQTAIPDKVWKRVSDPRGLPEQDASVFVKARKTLKEDIIHNKDLLHKYSQRLFDDRMFIVNEDDPGHTAGEELALNQAIGVNKYKSPIVAKIAEYIAPGLEGLKVGLSVWRAGFNLFTWRDPFLTSLFFFGAIFILCVLIVFPWRLFFFVMGVGAVGPQNWAIRLAGLVPKKKKKQEDPQKSKKGKKKTLTRRASADGYFEFHNHCTTDQGIDVRDQRTSKATGSVHRAIVPYSPLISRRFYDWPPNPSLSKVDICGEK